MALLRWRDAKLINIPHWVNVRHQDECTKATNHD